MADSWTFSHANLRRAAFAYRDSGWSVIPLRGDTDWQNPKAASVAWSAYQRRLPSYSEIESWFDSANPAGALGIVCGVVSGLVVLDFDDPACWAAFQAYCPHLIDTYTVQSGGRQLPHLYFALMPGLTLSARRIRGLDVLSDGRYVVAAPSQMQGRTWQVLHDAPVRLLDETDAAQLAVFVEVWAFQADFTADFAPNTLAGDTLYRNTCYGMQRVATLNPEALLGWYQRQVWRMGRNNALYRAASLARDCGWTQQQAEQLLIDVHVIQPAPAGHAPETVTQRQREARQTVRSAFRQGVRRVKASGPVRFYGLPNVIREKLLQQGQVAVARVLDGLYLLGIEAGRQLTERMMCHLLQAFNIGRRTVQAALKSITETGESFFSAPQTPQDNNANAAGLYQTGSTKCDFVRGANRVKTGRQPREYVMPDNARLCDLYAVRSSGSDPLTGADLASPDAYRQALHTRLIERRPALYSRRWLAQRLGISVWTSRRYDQQRGIVPQPTYFARHITWETLALLPDVPLPGCFLETPDGRRYPPQSGVARRLLRQHAMLSFKRQYWNYYTTQPSAEPYPTQAPVAESVYQAATDVPPAVPVSRVITMSNNNITKAVADAMLSQTHTSPDFNQWPAPPPATQAQEAKLTERLYEAIRQRNPERSLTRHKAAELVRTHGDKAVERALAILARRPGVRNAAGFVITLLTGRTATNSTGPDTHTHEEWLARLKASPYAAYYEIQ